MLTDGAAVQLRLQPVAQTTAWARRVLIPATLPLQIGATGDQGVTGEPALICYVAH